MAMMAHITYHAVIFHENPPDILPPYMHILREILPAPDILCILFIA